MAERLGDLSSGPGSSVPVQSFGRDRQPMNAKVKYQTRGLLFCSVAFPLLVAPVVAIAAAAPIGAVSAAQAAADAAPGDGERAAGAQEGTAVEQVTVTARRREERLIDV